MALLAQASDSAPRVDNPYVRVVERADVASTRSHSPRVLVYLPRGETAYVPAGTAAPTRAGRAIEIELKAGGDRAPVDAGSLDPVQVDPSHYKVELENGQVRVLRARYGAGESGAFHKHERDRVTVLLTPGELEITAPDGSRAVLRGKPFDIGWGKVASHSEKNLAATPFEIIAVELKAR
jgi:hypothetical protein